MTKNLPCPVECGNAILRPGLGVCGQCWMTVTAMCKGKDRLEEQPALARARRAGMVAYYCEVCGEWHNATGDQAKADQLLVKARRVMSEIRKERGWGFVLKVVTSWDPRTNEETRQWRRSRSRARHLTTV